MLFTTDVATQGPEALAAQLGPSVSLVSLRKCVDDPRTDARVTADFRRAVDEIGFEGLPTVWIGAQSVMGFKPAESLRAVIDRELKETRDYSPRGHPRRVVVGGARPGADRPHGNGREAQGRRRLDRRIKVAVHIPSR